MMNKEIQLNSESLRRDVHARWLATVELAESLDSFDAAVKATSPDHADAAAVRAYHADRLHRIKDRRPLNEEALHLSQLRDTVRTLNGAEMSRIIRRSRILLSPADAAGFRPAARVTGTILGLARRLELHAYDGVQGIFLDTDTSEWLLAHTNWFSEPVAPMFGFKRPQAQKSVEAKTKRITRKQILDSI